MRYYALAVYVVTRPRFWVAVGVFFLVLGVALFLHGSSVRSVPVSTAEVGLKGSTSPNLPKSAVDIGPVRAGLVSGGASSPVDDATVRVATVDAGSGIGVPSSDHARTTPPESAISIQRFIQVFRGSPITRDRDAGDVELAIVEASREFGVDPARLLAVAKCESQLREVPRVGRAQEIGWFQWLPSTWEWLAPKSGLGYTILDIGNVTAQARLTSWAFAAGYADPPHSYWTCAK